jgi:hypothetical protein
MIKNPAYYQARLQAIADEIKRETDDKRIKLLQNGYFPDYQPSPARRTEPAEVSHSSPENNSPLTFLEICSWDTWFDMHPEKICGKTVITTSRSFPLEVKASPDDVIRTIAAGIEKAQQTRIRIAKAKLKLLKLNL